MGECKGSKIKRGKSMLMMRKLGAFMKRDQEERVNLANLCKPFAQTMFKWNIKQFALLRCKVVLVLCVLGMNTVTMAFTNPGMKAWGAGPSGPIIATNMIHDVLGEVTSTIQQHDSIVVPWAVEGNERYTMSNPIYHARSTEVAEANAQGVLGGWRREHRMASFHWTAKGNMFAEGKFPFGFGITNSPNPWATNPAHRSTHNLGIFIKDGKLVFENYRENSSRKDSENIELLMQQNMALLQDTSKWHTFEVRMYPVADVKDTCFRMSVKINGENIKVKSTGDSLISVYDGFFDDQYFNDILELYFGAMGTVADFAVTTGGDYYANYTSAALFNTGNLVYSSEDPTKSIHEVYEVPRILGILYAPPGDASTAEFSNSTSISEFHTLTAGIEGSMKFGVGVNVKPEVLSGYFGAEIEGGFTVESSTNSELKMTSTRTVGSNIKIPGGGEDIAMVEMTKIYALLVARPRLNNIFYALDHPLRMSIDDDVPTGYVTDLVFIPSLPSPPQPYTISELLKKYGGDDVPYGSNVIANLQELYVKGIEKTSSGYRISQNVDETRLNEYTQGTTVIRGGVIANGNNTTVARTSTSTQSFNFKMGAYLNSKLTFGSVMVNSEFSLNISAGYSVGSSVETSRSVNYSYSDNDEWDYFLVKYWEDPRFGVRVFANDETVSYSSGPWEAGTRPSVAFEITVSDSEEELVLGELAICTLSIKNITSRKEIIDPPRILSVARDVDIDNYENYEIESILPMTAEIPVNHTQKYIIKYIQKSPAKTPLPLLINYGYGTTAKYHHVDYIYKSGNRFVFNPEPMDVSESAGKFIAFNNKASMLIAQANGAVVEQNNGSHLSANATWQVDTTAGDSGRYFRLINRETSLALVVSTTGDSLLALETPSDQLKQQWYLENAEDGYVRICSRYSGKVIGVANNSKELGAKLVSRFNTGSTSEQWSYSTPYPWIGNGSIANPWQIQSLEDLRQMAVIVNEGQSDLLNEHLLLTQNIDASITAGWDENRGWNPIGYLGNRFRGNFDGGGHTISNLYINRLQLHVGLFGFVDTEGRVKNLGMQDVSIRGGNSTGALIGGSNGQVYNSFATGSVAGGNAVGGLIGYSTDTVSNCYTTTEVSGSAYVGSLVGTNDGSISNCYTTGLVVASSLSYGVIGWQNSVGNTKSCYYDNETSGFDNVANATGLPTANMKQLNLHADTTWDFGSIWQIHAGVNEGYPFLRWQPAIVADSVDSISALGATLYATVISAGNGFNDAGFIWTQGADTAKVSLGAIGEADELSTAISELHPNREYQFVFYAIYGGDTLLSSPKDWTTLKLEVSIVPDSIAITKGEEDPELNFVATPSLVDGGVFTGSLTREPGDSVGNYEILPGSLSAGDDYILTFVPSAFVIKPAAIVGVMQSNADYSLMIKDAVLVQYQIYDMLGAMVFEKSSGVSEGWSAQKLNEELHMIGNHIVGRGRYLVIVDITDKNGSERRYKSMLEINQKNQQLKAR
jgi:hypothetical protein